MLECLEVSQYRIVVVVAEREEYYLGSSKLTEQAEWDR
jgi:hypothetical protein